MQTQQEAIVNDRNCQVGKWMHKLPQVAQWECLNRDLLHLLPPISRSMSRDIRCYSHASTQVPCRREMVTGKTKGGRGVRGKSREGLIPLRWRKKKLW